MFLEGSVHPFSLPSSPCALPVRAVVLRECPITTTKPSSGHNAAPLTTPTRPSRYGGISTQSSAAAPDGGAGS